MKQETIQKIYMWGILIFITAYLVTGAFWYAHEPTVEPIVKPEQEFGAVSVSIDGETKDISYTDENEGEDLIIKSDNERYLNVTGGITVHYSIYNSSKDDQNVNTAFSFSDGETKYVKRIWEYNGEEEIIIPAYEVSISSTTKETKTIPGGITYKTKWKEIGLNDFTEKTIERKDIKDTEPLKEATVFIKAGETKFLKAELNIVDFINEDEFFIEAFGDKGSYGMLDPFVFEDGFNSDTKSTGDLNSQDGWTCGAEYDIQNTVYAEGDQAGIIGEADASCAQTISDVDDGIVYVYMRSEGSGTGEWKFIIDETQNAAMIVSFEPDGYISLIYDGATEDMRTYTNGNWYLIAVEFDVDTDEFRGRVYDVDDTEVWTSWTISLAMRATVTTINTVRFYGDTNSITRHWDKITGTNPYPDAADPVAPISQPMINYN